MGYLEALLSDQDQLATSSLMPVLDVVMQLAAGDYSARGAILGENEGLDALMTGVNMLSEEVAYRFAENARLVQELEQNLAKMSAQQETILSLSTPSLLVWKGIVVLPLIGVLDTARAQRLTGELLNRVVQHSTDVVIIDVTGVAEADLETTNHLLNTFRAVRLLGSQCILTGLGPANARSLATLDVNLNDVAVRGTLHEGLKLAFGMTARRVVKTER